MEKILENKLQELADYFDLPLEEVATWKNHPLDIGDGWHLGFFEEKLSCESWGQGRVVIGICNRSTKKPLVSTKDLIPVRDLQVKVRSFYPYVVKDRLTNKKWIVHYVEAICRDEITCKV